MGDDGVEYADLGDVTICHRLAGPEDGPRVIYVSGSGSDLRREPNALSSPFVERCRVLAYDHRGLGRSTAGPAPPTMADFASDLSGLHAHVGAATRTEERLVWKEVYRPVIIRGP